MSVERFFTSPDSRSILPSITNMSLMDMCKNLGMKIEKRPVLLDELSSFEEVGACGTAAVITPIKKIVDPDLKKVYEFCKDGKPGPVSSKLYNWLTSIQTGDKEDIFGWIDLVE